MRQENKKREVVEEYLKGGVSLREIGEKHGMGHATIHRWLKEYESGGVIRARRMRQEVTSAMPK